jgi:hypothetical protein
MLKNPAPQNLRIPSLPLTTSFRLTSLILFFTLLSTLLHAIVYVCTQFAECSSTDCKRKRDYNNKNTFTDVL